MEHFHQQIQGWFTFPWLYKEMATRFPDGSHFVEVGCWLGCSAAYMGVEIVNSQKNIKFDCFDWFKGNPYNKNINYNDDPDPAFLKCKTNLEPFKNFLSVNKSLSWEGASKYKNNSLDFVFLDASHAYDDFSKDLQAWGPKVKANGVFAGHDTGFGGVSVGIAEYFGEDPPPNAHKDFDKLNHGFTRAEHYNYEQKLGGCWIWDKKIHGEPIAETGRYKHLIKKYGGHVEDGTTNPK